MKNETMFNFIKHHYMFFDRDNYWYSDKTIAKNVKLYNLDLTDWEKAYELLMLDNWQTINDMIEDWECEHEGTEVYFNGRSGGYLILKDKNYFVYSFQDYLDNDYEDYLEARNKSIEFGYTNKQLTEELKRQYNLVKEFDKLCDNLEKELQYMIDNWKIVEEEVITKNTIKKIDYGE